jgi:uncharacterized membrane protein
LPSPDSFLQVEHYIQLGANKAGRLTAMVLLFLGNWRSTLIIALILDG